MSTEHSQHTPVRLLIAEASENSAHEFDSILRDAGIATRMRVVDLPMAGDALSGADLMLCNAQLPQLEQILPQLHTRAPHVPIILVNPPDPVLSTSAGLKLGAADVVSRQDRDELVLVFKRELARVCQNHRVSELHRALQEAEQRCQLLLQSSTAAIAYVHEGMHIHANAGYLKLFGFDDADALLGLPLMDLLDDDSAGRLKQELKRVRQQDEECVLEFAGRASCGAAVVGTMTLTSAEYEGEACLQVIVRSDAPIVRSDAPIVRSDAPAPAHPPATTNGGTAAAAGNGAAANGDALASANGSADRAPQTAATGVEAFIAAAGDLQGSVHSHRVIAVAAIDAFTGMQDELGLRGADQAAARVQETLGEALGRRPLVRLGLGQYAFTITDGDRAQVLERVESLRKSVEGLMIEIAGRTVRTTISIGGVELEDATDVSAGELCETALNTAFAAARRAANAGGNRVAVLSKEVARAEPDSEAAEMLSRINDAIDKQRFVLLFQPIISLRGDSDEHYEVFLRMVGEDGRQIAPNEFLRTAIQHQVAAKIDRWVILQSIKMLSTHRSKGHNTRLTINLTANSVADPEFLQWLSVAIKAARLPSDAVIFQITEQDAADQVRQTSEFVEGLKAMHCRASLSRFGLVKDPMELLEHIPADFVKLDGSHVERLLDDPSLKDQLTGTIRALQGTGKLTIIPMVESAGVLSALWQAGANYIQGHYLQEPSTEMDFDFSTDD